MTRGEIQAVVLRVLSDVAPEIDPSRIRPDVGLREQIDLDSMDFLNFLIALHKELGIEIPEADYSKLVTLDACTDYLHSRLESSGNFLK
jgi:acyl carrier protein